MGDALGSLAHCQQGPCWPCVALPVPLIPALLVSMLLQGVAGVGGQGGPCPVQRDGASLGSWPVTGQGASAFFPGWGFWLPLGWALCLPLPLGMLSPGSPFLLTYFPHPCCHRVRGAGGPGWPARGCLLAAPAPWVLGETRTRSADHTACCPHGLLPHAQGCPWAAFLSCFSPRVGGRKGCPWWEQDIHLPAGSPTWVLNP